MKVWKGSMKNYIFFSVLFLVLIPRNVKSQVTLSEDRFIEINGIPQWVSIHGDRSKPVIMFLHGGPGSPLSLYSEAIYHAWEKDFIIVQWDQRGTAKTYGVHAPAELNAAYLKSNPLTTEQMCSDGIKLTEYLIKYLGKQKLILFGSSWGSVLGILMAGQRPDLYYAYVGHSQVIDPADNFLFVYDKVNRMAKAANDRKSLDILQLLGLPPYDEAKKYGQLLRIVKQYEKQNSVPAPVSYWVVTASYDNAKDGKDREEGDDYSFVNYTGDKRLDITPMMTRIHFSTSELDFKIPVYLIQGQEDILTSKEITKPWFDKIRAPKKEYILIPGAAHGFNQSVLDSQFKIMKQIDMPDK